MINAQHVNFPIKWLVRRVVWYGIRTILIRRYVVDWYRFLFRKHPSDLFSCQAHLDKHDYSASPSN